MKDLIITICRDTRKVKLNRGFIGLNGENLQGNIIVDFTDKAEFVDGTACLEVVQNGTPYSLPMEQDGANKAYKLPIKSSLLAYACELLCQVVIRQEETADGVPVFKSEKFKLPCYQAINATETIPEQYPSWLEIASAKLAEMDDAIERVNQITKWYHHFVKVRTLGDIFINIILVTPREEKYDDISDFLYDCIIYGAIFECAQDYLVKVITLYHTRLGYIDEHDIINSIEVISIEDDEVTNA